jgi:hypothetical protein
MDLAYAASDVGIARSGAATVSELAGLGIPAIFVPYPVGNGEQERNAEELITAGGALLCRDADFTPRFVSDTVVPLLADALFDLLKIYWKWSPNTKYLLVNVEGKPLDRSNQITRRLNSLFGKKISSSMLRNIFLTEKFATPMAELKEATKAMGTSTNVAMNQYIKES